MSREARRAAASSASTPDPQPQYGEGDRWAEAGRTPLERTADAVEDLYRLRDTFFPRDPAEKPAALRARADAALAVLDSLPSEQRKSPQQRAVYEFLRGKILDVFPDYQKEAEDHLSKAVKLNPSLVDAWLCLGNCIWKKGDLASAKNCFLLVLSKVTDKNILCQLSMLERSMAQGRSSTSNTVGCCCIASSLLGAQATAVRRRDAVVASTLPSRRNVADAAAAPSRTQPLLVSPPTFTARGLLAAAHRQSGSAASAIRLWQSLPGRCFLHIARNCKAVEVVTICMVLSFVVLPLLCRPLLGPHLQAVGCSSRSHGFLSCSPCSWCAAVL